jgi:hypothetical protein
MEFSLSRLFSTDRLLLGLALAYFLASFGHFSHNAEFICEYPNLPGWIARGKVYASWAAITAVGAAGLFLLWKTFIPAGLILVAAYAALGFYGLGHYALAPIEFHTLGANITILSEVAAAALLLPFTLYLLARHLRNGRRAF